MRRDHYDYYPSDNPFADLGPIQQETVAQDRTLTNAGLRSDLSYVKGIHNVKLGATYQQTFLDENTRFGIVDPFLNAPCLDASGAPVAGFNDPRTASARTSPTLPPIPTRPRLSCRS